MKKQKKLGPVSAQERRDYRARLGPDADRGCPMVETAAEVWRLLAKPLGIALDDVTPVGKQALVVVLDTVIAAGHHATGDLFHRIFDALASRWSLAFRDAGTRGAFTVYNMAEDTVRISYRELLLSEIPLAYLWQHAVQKWDGQGGKNPLYDVSRVPRGSYRISGVDAATSALRDFTKIAWRDTRYRRTPHGPQLLLDDDPWPDREPQQEVSAEWAFNIVQLEEESKRLIEIQESTQLYFKVNTFRWDYEHLHGRREDLISRRVVGEEERIAQELQTHYGVDAALDGQIRIRQGKRTWSDRHKSVFTAIPSTAEDYQTRRRAVWIRLAEYDRLRSIASSVWETYDRTNRIPLLQFDEDGVGGFEPPLYSYRLIKSGFARAINRRYQPTNFWPMNVPALMRDRWFAAYVPASPTAQHKERYLVEVPPMDLVDVDVSSSQTQILAVLLGIDELEERACSRELKFKKYLANEALRRHGESGGLLADGYEGEVGYGKLVAFVKEFWMRTLYGSAPQEVVFNLAKEVDDYGLGWKTKAGLWEPGWLHEATEKATYFLGNFPWYGAVEKYLHACQHLAKRVVSDAEGKFRGAVFTDPLDGVKVRWNPIRRAPKPVKVGKFCLYPSLPGRLGKGGRFRRALRDSITGDYAVDQGRLGRQIAPMVVHMLDAYFSSLVIKRLWDVGVRDVVGIHDNWHVPAHYQKEEDGPDGPWLSGREALDTTVLAAGEEWFRGLGSIYQEFIGYLGDTEDGKWFQDAEAKWKARVLAKRWPRFAAL